MLNFDSGRRSWPLPRRVLIRSKGRQCVGSVNHFFLRLTLGICSVQKMLKPLLPHSRTLVGGSYIQSPRRFRNRDSVAAFTHLRLSVAAKEDSKRGGSKLKLDPAHTTCGKPVPLTLPLRWWDKVSTAAVTKCHQGRAHNSEEVFCSVSEGISETQSAGGAVFHPGPPGNGASELWFLTATG